MNKKDIKKKRQKINKILIIILFIIIIILFSTILILNVIPIIYTILLFLFSLIFLIFLILSIFSKKNGFRLIGYLLSLILIISSLIIEIYLVNTLGFLFNVTNGEYIIKNYNVIVLNNSSYSKIKDLNNKVVGIYDEDEELKKNLNKKIDISYKYYDTKDILIDNLIKENIDAIILEENELNLLKDTNIDIYNKIKNIYNIEVKNKIENTASNKNINKDSFNIYLSGIDTYGSIKSVSRSDVNILISVNPKDEKILMTWIPRDYFVDINKGVNDKLTHAGMYGIDTSISSIEKLLDVNIDYYFKVNFTSVIKLVDLLKGIEVYNDETFTTIDNYTFKEGYITLNGTEALSFVRERKGVSGGDIGRGRNQVKVLTALFNKVLNKNIIKNYNKLLSSLYGSFVTNMNQNTISSFIKRELLKRRNWQIESIILKGSDSREYTYSVPNQTLYVMVPDEDMVNNTKEEIKKVLSHN